MQVLHVFFDVNMNKSFRGLTQILEDKTKRGLHSGECAIFVGSRWNATKILYPDGVMLYWRGESVNSLTYERLKQLPMEVADALTFNLKSERALLTASTDTGGRKRYIPRSVTEDDLRT